MSSFNCEYCGTAIIDTPNGYMTGCIHYPLPAPLPRDDGVEAVKALFKNVTGVDVEVRVVNGEFFVIDPDGQEFKTGLVHKH